MMVPGLSTCLTSLAPLANRSMSSGHLRVPLKLIAKIRRKVLLHSSNTSPPQWITPMSQRCRIYQLEDVHICPGENPDELIENICVLTDQCGFPSNEEKERNIRYSSVCALSASDLVHKPLSLKLTATTSEMLEICCMHIAISDNMNAMGLTGSKSVNAICHQKQQHQ